MKLGQLNIADKRILIVDADQVRTRNLERLLRNIGYHLVATCSNVQDASAMQQRQPYDLILNALNTVSSDAPACIEWISEIDRSNVPLVAIAPVAENKLPAFENGIRHFVSYPFDSIAVQTCLHTALELHYLKKQRDRFDQQVHLSDPTALHALRESEELFRQIALNLPQALLLRDPDGQRIRFINRAWEKICGRTVVIGDHFSKLGAAVYPDDLSRLRHEAKKFPFGGTDFEFRLQRPDKVMRWVHARTFPISNSQGKLLGVAALVSDISERKEAEQRLAQLAHYDTLTGLPNRTLFYELLKKALAQAEEHQLNVSLIFIDLDRFKNVNDTLGHSFGDSLLTQVAQRLTQALRLRDTLGRLGGDEFGLILAGSEDPVGAGIVANKILKILRQPFALDGREVTVTASIGISVSPTDSRNSETLIKYADTAMFQAKDAGRDTFRFYTAKMNLRALEKLDLEIALRKAVDNDEFILYYQPKFEIEGSRCTGVEALIRWRRPGFGLVSPSVFVPLLEETGLVVPVGNWVIDTVCRQIRVWTESKLEPFKVAFNVSAKQFFQENFVTHITDAINGNAIAADMLEVEITESVLMSHAQDTEEVLHQLRELNIGIAIDDFGTGYSSLAYLKHFPIDKLKIDVAFIRDVTTNADDAAITAAIISMAHSLKLKVIAEGGENKAQLDFLREHACDEMQGFYYSRPLSVVDLESFRRTNCKPLS